MDHIISLMQTTQDWWINGSHKNTTKTVLEQRDLITTTKKKLQPKPITFLKSKDSPAQKENFWKV